MLDILSSLGAGGISSNSSASALPTNVNNFNGSPINIGSGSASGGTASGQPLSLPDISNPSGAITAIGLALGAVLILKMIRK